MADHATDFTVSCGIVERNVRILRDPWVHMAITATLASVWVPVEV